MKAAVLLALWLLLTPPPCRPGGATVRATLRLLGTLPDGDDWQKVLFTSGTQGWLFSRSSIWRTVNGGLLWHPVASPEPDRRARFAVDDLQFFAGTGFLFRHDRLFKTTDAAKTWIELPPLPSGGDLGGEIRGVSLQNAGRVRWAFGGVYRRAKAGELGPNNVMDVGVDGARLILDAAVFSTEDGGRHWVRQQLPSAPVEALGYRVTQVCSYGADRGVAAAEFGVAYTEDGGDHWKLGRVDDPAGASGHPLFDRGATIRLVYLFDRQRGWLSPDDGSLYRTEDGGASWRRVLTRGTIHSQSSTVASHFMSMAFSSPVLGWAVEFSGTLMETQDGGQSWLKVSAPTQQFEQVFLLDGEHIWALSDEGLYQITVRQ